MLNAKIIKEISLKTHSNIGSNDGLPFGKQIIIISIILGIVMILVMLID